MTSPNDRKAIGRHLTRKELAARYCRLNYSEDSILILTSTQSNASCSLLRLPPEIKNNIYELVRGGQFVHLKTIEPMNSLSYLTNHISVAEITEEEAQKRFDEDLSSE